MSYYTRHDPLKNIILFVKENSLHDALCERSVDFWFGTILTFRVTLHKYHPGEFSTMKLRAQQFLGIHFGNIVQLVYTASLDFITPVVSKKERKKKAEEKGTLNDISNWQKMKETKPSLQALHSPANVRDAANFQRPLLSEFNHAFVPDGVALTDLPWMLLLVPIAQPEL